MLEENETEDEQSTNESSEEKKVEENSAEEKLYDKEDKKEKKDDGSKDDKGDDKSGDEKEAKDDKKDDDKADDKKEEKSKDDKKTPEKYELELPKESVLQKEHLEKIESFAKEQGFSQEQAQAQVERDNQLIVEAREEAKAELARLADDVWPKEAKDDKEIGGDNFKESAELAKRVFKRYGSEKLRDILNDTGYGNHPELLRFAVKIGKSMAEDKFVAGSSSQSGEKDIAEVFYGD